MTAADIQTLAAAFLPLERYILVSLYPEDFEQQQTCSAGERRVETQHPLAAYQDLMRIRVHAL